MLINSIYRSIQGEGVLAQLPMVFVRLQGCNLRCLYCDTVYAQDKSHGMSMTVPEVLSKVIEEDSRPKGWVCITGGEPLTQEHELHELVKGLRKLDYRVTIETNGSKSKPFWWTLVDSWVADYKCPSSGMEVHMGWEDDWFSASMKDQVKFVVGTQADLDCARKIIERHPKSPVQVLVSPVLQVENFQPSLGDENQGKVIIDNRFAQKVADFCLEMNLRMSIQIHKMVWGNRRDA